MIKPLKSSDKIVRPFKTFKKWSFTNTDSSDVILLEQFLENAEDGNASPTLGYENGNGSSPEQQELGEDEIDINVKHGELTSGTFYPRGHYKYVSEKEPMNFDGTYHRVVYNTIKHLFYNDYFVQHYDFNEKKSVNIKNPFMLFGVESAEFHDPSVIEDIDTGDEYTERRIERRVLGDNLIVLEIPRKHFGEKIRPTTLKITDFSSEFEIVEIVDDGYTNLITREGIFEDVKRVSFSTADRIAAYKDASEKFDPRDFSFGKQLSSSGKYFITGCPMGVDELSESQAGSAFLYEHDTEKNSFRLLRAFECPFTQNGLALEQRHDHNNLLLKQVSGVLLSNDYSLNDNFGNAVELNKRYCAIGASKSHIRGESREASTGHVFVYERNKGGNDHWGLLNILEGLPGSEFGASISIDGDLMAVGAPGITAGPLDQTFAYLTELLGFPPTDWELTSKTGAVYIFRREDRVQESTWNRITDVPEGYAWDSDTKRFKGYPQDHELAHINEPTTRWKVTSVIPDGSILECFADIGTLTFESGSCDSGSFGSGSWTSGSFESGSWTSGSFESGSWTSGSFESGSWTSGSCTSGSWVSGTIPSELECPCDYITFGGEDILSHGTTKSSGTEFDAGYDPHEYDKSPRRSWGDSHWVLDSYVITNDSKSCDKFGEEVKLVGNTLYVSTPSSKRQTCYVFNRGSWEDCQKWKEVHRITREGILDVLSETFVATNPPPRSASITYPYEYSEPDKHQFGKSIDATETHLVIGDPLDRKFSSMGITHEAGTVYIYDLSLGGIKFKNKLYGEFDYEDSFSTRFGNSVSLLEKDLLVGAHCTDSSNIEIDDTGISVDDYYLGATNLSEETYTSASGEVNAIEGRAFYYRLGDDVELLKNIKINKWKNSVRRQYAYAVSLSSDYIYVGTPVIGNFPFSELNTFDGTGLSSMRDYKINPYEQEAREAMFAYYGLDELQLQLDDREFAGQVIAYKTESVRFSKKTQVGNVFYKNGIIVLTELKNHLEGVLQGSFSTGYKIEFNGTHTLYETEILCEVNPNEFNVSTNPTSLLHQSIMYDVNGDGKFDITDLIYIYKFLTGYEQAKIPGIEDSSDGDVPGGIAVEQDTHWPNSDILLTESEDAILMFFTEAASNVVISEYEKALPILEELKSAGEFDLDDDGYTGSTDAKLLVRYFRGRTGIELTGGLLNKFSKRRIPKDIVKFLDIRTGKDNGVEILSDFEKYTDLDRVMNAGKNMESLYPYATTIGLYSGLDLVAIAKLGKPTKITPSYPINFLIKYDG